MKQESKIPEFKPCPFCGGNAEVSVNAQALSTKVCCKHCEVTMKRNFKGSKEIKELLVRWKWLTIQNCCRRCQNE